MSCSDGITPTPDPSAPSSGEATFLDRPPTRRGRGRRVGRDHGDSSRARRLPSNHCQVRPPRRILDLGSGFSPVTLRLYTEDMDPKPEVSSVDDSKEWQARTHGSTSSCTLGNMTAHIPRRRRFDTCLPAGWSYRTTSTRQARWNTYGER